MESTWFREKLATITRMKNASSKTSKTRVRRPGDFPQLLTRREIEIVHWCAAGKSNAEQAVILDISEHTVNFHIKNIYQKLDVQTRAAAVNAATSMGLVFNDPSGNKKIVQDIYKSFVEGNRQPLLNILDDNTEWVSTAPENLFPHAGRYKGLKSILTQIEMVSTSYEARSFLPRIFVKENDQICCLA